MKRKAKKTVSPALESDQDRVAAFLSFSPEVQKAYLRAMQSIDPSALTYLETHPEASKVLKQFQLEEVLSDTLKGLKR
ncbi:hypothetical protein [Deinococcus cellulosilyticus]|uniref:Uncharacterized protein n=1 Tax=Deinococcus cellulosilyticus (strain DSM 18568 / NBRC 106333 / KACC 11606 / 5516J-15) TaxID=1223518 RepID=A0A511MZY1_DEIC1|nr:hypothetical protein [Deinococcus cellulosilyticus]GEM46154.1 hypothetical protein DC3_17890 [Deinococcus cellulosilyticus NBRC 106333 = KACC 11606]